MRVNQMLSVIVGYKNNLKFFFQKKDTILDIKVKEGDTYDLNCVADKTYTHCSWQHLGTKEKCTFNNNLNHDVCNINSNSWIVENRIIGMLEFPRARH